MTVDQTVLKLAAALHYCTVQVLNNLGYMKSKMFCLVCMQVCLELLAHVGVLMLLDLDLDG